MLRKNIIINYSGTGLVGVVNIASLFGYIKIFGVESWGVIAAYIAIMNLIMMAELGLSQAYISGYSHSKNKTKNFRLHQFALMALTMFGVFVVLVFYFLSNLVAVKHEGVEREFNLLLLSAFIAGLNLQNNFYYTHLIAGQRMAAQNARWVTAVIVKNSLALTCAKYIDAQPLTYFFVFLIASTFELLANELSLKKTLGRLAPFSIVEVFDVLLNFKGLSAAIAIGMLAFSADRLILQNLVTPTVFGVYAAIVTLGLYFLQLQYPISKAIFPYMAQQSSEATNRSQIGRSPSLMVASLMAPPLLLGIVFSYEIVSAFSDPGSSLVIEAQVLFVGVLAAVFVNSLYHPMYLKMVLGGRVKLIMGINFVSLAVVICIMSVAGKGSPFWAGAFAWVLVALVQLSGALIFISRRKNQ